MNKAYLLSLFDQNEALVERFLNIFKTQTPIQLDALQEAIERGNLESAAIMAHSIKSQCRYMGLDAAAQLCQSIEQAKDPRLAAEWLAALRQILDESIRGL